MSGSLGYTNALTQYAIDHTADSQLVKDQLANPDTDVITNLPFRQEGDTEPTDQEKAQAIGNTCSPWMLSPRQRPTWTA